MSRAVPSGTPTRANGYVAPPDRGRPLLAGVGLAIAILVVFAALFAMGRRGVASPGKVSSAHEPINQRCAECHVVGLSVSDLRCERCHDPARTHRLSQASHVLRSPGASAHADAAENLACSPCHAEHRGTQDLARAVDDSACVRCHAFPSLAQHPEFVAVRAGGVTGVGVKFTHDRHLAEVGMGGRRCDACHQLAADLSGFEPIDFDRHCASCHTKDGFLTGETDPLDARLVSTASTGSPVLTPGARSLITVSRMAHRDPWVLDNLARLRRIADPDGESAERLSLQTQIAALSSRLLTQPVSALPPADLDQLRVTLVRELASPDTASAPSSDDGRALEAMTSALRALGGTLQGDALLADDSALALQSSDLPEQTPGATQARVEARKAELLSVLDAVAARGNPELASRAAALRARVTAIADAGPSGNEDAEQLRARLRGLDEIFSALRGMPDQQAAAAAAALAALRDAASQQITGGLPVDQFEARRAELLRALDAIARQGNSALQSRIGPLRVRVLMLRPGEPAANRRARVQELLDRVTLEIELARGGETAGPSAIASDSDRRALQSRIDTLSQQLARLGAPNGVAVLGAPAADEAANAIATLAGPCLKCHVMNGAGLAPVATTGRVFRRAEFTHKPHVLQADCLTCHAAVTTSKRATDLIVPGMATCQSCHASSKAPSTCTTCHTYHPAAAGELGELP